MQLTNVISAIDSHACGEPGRVIIGGVINVPGKTMFEKKQWLETCGDDLRKRSAPGTAWLSRSQL